MRTLEWTLGLLGLTLCAAGSGYAWHYLFSEAASPQQRVWPLPGGYLVEMIVLGIVGLASIAFNKAPHSPRWGGVTWSVAGAVLGFAVLGAWSIGPLYLPAASALAAAGILADQSRGRSALRHMGFLVLGAILQAGLMIGMVFLLRAGIRWG